VSPDVLLRANWGSKQKGLFRPVPETSSRWSMRYLRPARGEKVQAQVAATVGLTDRGQRHHGAWLFATKQLVV
jgi:hypothetical protein